MNLTPQPPIDQLVELLLACHAHCTQHGGNVPDLISAALTQAAYQLGGSYALIEHRPGSWEAAHVQALAAGADYQLDPNYERPY